MASYEVFPMVDPPDLSRAHIIEGIVRRICGFEAVFNDFQRGCEQRCYESKPVTEVCDKCKICMALVAQSLAAPNSRVWEVWNTEGDQPSVVGVIYVTDIVPGEDATGHYVFFDNDLRGKTGVLKEVISWLFSDHEEIGWKALRRLTVEIPEFAYALARHAHRQLGFGGPFSYSLRPHTKPIGVEGVKRKRVPWRGTRKDLLILGLVNEAA